MCEGYMKGANIVGIVGVSMKIVQTIINQFKEGGTYKENTMTRRPTLLVREIFIEFYSLHPEIN